MLHLNTQTLWVPLEGLNSTTHSAGTRLIWMLLGLGSSGASSSLTDARLRRLSGLDRKTVATARAALARAPHAPCYRKPHPSCAAIPVALLTTAEISAGARLLYGQLQGVPNFDDQVGSFTYGTLSRLTGTSVDSLKRAVAELVATGWLTITQANRKSPLSFTLRNPVSVRLRARISAIRRKVRKAEHRGETLLREFLNVLIALEDYEDNACPDLLLNPYTRELMELDRYYPTAGVAVEYNGDQHYEETDLATFGETVKQVGRDAMKAFICRARGIELSIIHPEDLTLKKIDLKIPRRLPRRELEGMGPLVAALEEMAAEHRERTADEREQRRESNPDRNVRFGRT
ncbi:MAG TPA: helix-turn-helix domain-containing protein [Symbiobacteriaceae bacterium]|nr:helix-turn-helix domain-containing protein [Symbiobacteriaceae bacterium]